MRVTKSLLCGISTFAIATGAAFAGQDSTVHGSVETSPPEMLSEQYREPTNEELLSLREEEALMLEDELTAQEEGDVIYLYPMEVTEYYLVIPRESGEMPG